MKNNKNITNREYLENLTSKDFANWLNYICDAYYAPKEGWEIWLESEYSKDDVKKE